MLRTDEISGDLGLRCVFRTDILAYTGSCRYIFTWWRHQMETFSALLALCAENSPVTGEFPSQMPMTRIVDVSFICALNRRLSINKRKARDLRRHHAHYHVIVMRRCTSVASLKSNAIDCGREENVVLGSLTDSVTPPVSAGCASLVTETRRISSINTSRPQFDMITNHTERLFCI